MKDYKSILARYNFTDSKGHELEFCQDYLDLLAEAARTQSQLDEAVAKERERCITAIEKAGERFSKGLAGLGPCAVVACQTLERAIANIKGGR